eukprot:1187988-Pleurochrysis_carterae.AAC.1
MRLGVHGGCSTAGMPTSFGSDSGRSGEAAQKQLMRAGSQRPIQTARRCTSAGFSHRHALVDSCAAPPSADFFCWRKRVRIRLFLALAAAVPRRGVDGRSGRVLASRPHVRAGHRRRAGKRRGVTCALHAARAAARSPLRALHVALGQAGWERAEGSRARARRRGRLCGVRRCDADAARAKCCRFAGVLRAFCGRFAGVGHPFCSKDLLALLRGAVSLKFATPCRVPFEPFNSGGSQGKFHTCVHWRGVERLPMPTPPLTHSVPPADSRSRRTTPPRSSSFARAPPRATRGPLTALVTCT